LKADRQQSQRSSRTGHPDGDGYWTWPLEQIREPVRTTSQPARPQ
jgi:hypothetical protein